MQVELACRPAQAIAVVQLQPGESLVAEAGALVAMSTAISLETSTGGGILKGLKRMFGGETFFRNTFRATDRAGEVRLAPALCGDMLHLDVSPGEDWLVQSGAFVASGSEVELDTKLDGFRGFFSGAGIFVLKAHGRGPLVLGAFGAIVPVDVDGTFIVDTGHLVAWSPDLQFRVTKASEQGWIASFLSGEGLIAEFSGKGRLWFQTRNPTDYGSLIGSMLPPRAS